MSISLFTYRSCQPRKKVHISFDDVWIGHNGVGDFITSLKLYNTVYGAKFSLYTFDVPDDCRPIANESAPDWIKFSYHGSDIPFDTLSATHHYVTTLSQQLKSLRYLYGDSCISNTVRLHYYYADSTMLNVARDAGIATFLSADAKGRISYSLDSALNDTLFYTGSLTQADRKFYRTDIRMEHSTLSDCILNNHLSDSTLVVFTHQCAFGRRARVKMHLLMMFLWLNNFEYVTNL